MKKILLLLAVLAAFVPNSSAQVALKNPVVQSNIDMGLFSVGGLTSPIRPGSNVVFVGDSRIYGEGASHGTTDFPTVFGTLPICSGLGTVHNLGHDSTLLADMQGTYTAEVHPLSPAVTGKPGLLVINIGANNYVVGGFNPATWFSALQTYIAGARTDGYKICLLTVYPREDTPVITTTDALRVQMNNLIKINAATIADVVVPVDDYFPDPNDTNLYYDFAHLNATGQALEARYVAEALKMGGIPPLYGPIRANYANSWPVHQLFQYVQLHVTGGPGWYRVFTSTGLGGSHSELSIRAVDFSSNHDQSIKVLAGVAAISGTSSLTILDSAIASTSAQTIDQIRSATVPASGTGYIDIHLTGTWTNGALQVFCDNNYLPSAAPLTVNPSTSGLTLNTVTIPSVGALFNSNITAATFTGNGASLTSLTAANLTGSHTLPIGVLPADVPFTDVPLTWTAGQVFQPTQYSITTGTGWYRVAATTSAGGGHAILHINSGDFSSSHNSGVTLLVNALGAGSTGSIQILDSSNNGGAAQAIDQARISISGGTGTAYIDIHLTGTFSNGFIQIYTDTMFAVQTPAFNPSTSGLTLVPVTIPSQGGALFNRISIDPSKIGLFDQAFCFEGDSITAGTGPGLSSTTVYPYLLSSMSFMAGHGTYYNSAVGGSTIAGAVSRYTASVHPHRPAANGGDGGTKAWLFLLLGTNDLNQGRTDSQIVTDLNSLIATAHADGFTVVVATILPRYDGQAGSLFTTAGNYRLSVNQSIRDGTVTADQVVDLASLLSDPTNTAYYGDAVHPTVAANVLMARYYNGVLTAGAAPASAVPKVLDGDRIVNGAVTLTASTLIGTTAANYTALGHANVAPPDGHTPHVAIVTSDSTTTFGNGSVTLDINNADPTGKFVNLLFSQNNGNSTAAGVGYINVITPGTGAGFRTGEMAFGVGDGGSGQFEAMRIFHSLNVGIGVTSDDGVNKLQVNGSIKVQNSINYGGTNFGDPAAFNTSSSGDKVVLFNNGSDFDARIGIGGSANVWYKASGNSSGAGAHWFYIGSTPTVMAKIDSAGITVAGPVKATHLIGGTSAPTIAAGTGAGTSPTISVAGTDASGTITLTTGSSPAASATIATVTWNVAYGAAPVVVLQPANAATAALASAAVPFVSSSSTTTFVAASNGTALTASTAYKWTYIVVQ